MNTHEDLDMESLINISSESLIFPKEVLPPCFSNGDISEKLESIYGHYEANGLLLDNFELRDDGRIKGFKGYRDIDARVKKGAEPIQFVFEKPSGGPRILSVAHPLIQIPLHKYIVDNIETILGNQMKECENYCSNSRYFCQDKELYIECDYYSSKFVFENSGVLQQKKYKDVMLKKHAIAGGKYYKLYLDVSNFFHSIYTHTISWGVNDSEKDIFDNLDMLMRTQNNNETKGIIVGPYTSGLFAELIMAKVDKAMLAYIDKQGFDVSYVRYVDDIEMYSDNKRHLEVCLSEIEKQLLKYKLDINHSKTSISEFPFLQIISQSSKSVYQLKDRLKNNDYDGGLEKIEDIILEIKTSLDLGYSNAKYLLKMLRSVIKEEDIFYRVDEDIIWVLLDYLLNTMFKYQILTDQISLLILAILGGLQQADKELFVKKVLIKREAKQEAVKEIVDIWIVYFITKLDIYNSCVKEYFGTVIAKSVICSAMILNYYFSDELIWEENKVIICEYLSCIKQDLKAKYGGSCWSKAAWLSKYWLLFYLNETKWMAHKITGFKGTLLTEITLQKLMKDQKLKKQLSLYKVMCDLRVEVLNYETER